MAAIVSIMMSINLYCNSYVLVCCFQGHNFTEQAPGFIYSYIPRTECGACL